MLNKEIKDLIVTLLSDSEADNRRQAAEELSSTSSLMISAILSLALQDKDKGVRDSAARSLLNIQSNSVPYAIVEYLTDSSFITRNLSSNLLVNIGTPAIPALLPYFKHENMDVRKLALDTVGLICNKIAVPPILECLNDPDENVVVAAVEALGNIRDASSIPHLAMAYECYPFARVVIAEAFGKIGDSSASRFLVSLLRNLQNPEGEDLLITFAVIEALAAVGDEQSLEVIVPLIKESTGKLQHVLLYAYVSISNRLGVGIVDYEEYKPALIDALKDDDDKIIRASISGLVRVMDDEVEDKLLQSLGHGEESDNLIMNNLRNGRKAFALLVQQYDRASFSQKNTILNFLLPHLKENISYWFKELNESLSRELQNSASSFFDTLALDWNESDEETRTKIMDALFHLDQERALSYFTQLAEDADPWLRMQFLELAANVSHARINDLLAKFSNDENDFVREFVVSILGARGLSVENPETL
jgi:HEAT repeat protein